MEGIERLEAEVLEMNNCNISAIFDYLKTRKDLYEKFNNEEKTIHQMYEFIYKRAMKHKIGNVAMIDDKVVCLWAITYFKKSNAELGINNGKKEVITLANKNQKETTVKQENTPKENEPETNQISIFQEVEK